MRTVSISRNNAQKRTAIISVPPTLINRWNFQISRYRISILIWRHRQSGLVLDWHESCIFLIKIRTIWVNTFLSTGNKLIYTGGIKLQGSGSGRSFVHHFDFQSISSVGSCQNVWKSEVGEGLVSKADEANFVFQFVQLVQYQLSDVLVSIVMKKNLPLSV